MGKKTLKAVNAKNYNMAQCDLYKYEEVGLKDEYVFRKVFPCFFVPIERGSKCEVCHSEFEDNSEGTLIVLPRDCLDIETILCHKECYLLLTLKSGKSL